MFSPADILGRLKTEPFEPFEIQTSTGERYPVRHRENLLVGRNYCYVFSYEAELIDEMAQLALLHIVRLQPLRRGKTTGRQRKNGSR